MVSDIDVVDMTHFLKISKDTCILHSFNLHLHMYVCMYVYKRTTLARDIYRSGVYIHVPCD